MIFDMNNDNQKLTEEQQKLKDMFKSTIETYLEKKGIVLTAPPSEAEAVKGKHEFNIKENEHGSSNR